MTLMKTTLRTKPNMLLHDLQRTLASKAVSSRNYLSILTLPGARTALHAKLP